MPELPEVETVRRGLEPVLVGQALKRIIVRRKNLRFPLPNDLGQRLTGKTINQLDRRGKYLLMHIDGGDVLIAHLGMSGSFCIYPDASQPPKKHDHVIFITKTGTTVHYHDPRRFGFMLLTTNQELDDFPMLAAMGPEPVMPSLTGSQLMDRLGSRQTSIKAALLDQKVIAGIGNIYACEAMFKAGISPNRKAASIRGGRAEKLAIAIEDVLMTAIEAGGSSLKDHKQPNGELGYFQHTFKVYDQEGEICSSCQKNTIQRIVQNGRSTFYCSACQR